MTMKFSERGRRLYSVATSLILILGLTMGFAQSASAAPKCVRHIVTGYDSEIGNIKFYFLYNDLNSASGGYGTFAEGVVITDHIPQGGDGLWFANKLNGTHVPAGGYAEYGPFLYTNGKYKATFYPNVTTSVKTFMQVNSSQYIISATDTPYPLGTDYTCPS